MNLTEAGRLAVDLEREMPGATAGITRWNAGPDGWAVAAHLPRAVVGFYVKRYTGAMYDWQTSDGQFSSSAHGMAALVRAVRFKTLGESAATLADVEALADHIRSAHPTLVELYRQTRGVPFEDEGVTFLRRLPLSELDALHVSHHLPPYTEHERDNWRHRARPATTPV